MNDAKLCFVVMPFSHVDNLNDVWLTIKNGVFGDATLAARFRCLRGDEILGSRPILEDIRREIIAADLVITDLTGSNPNVFYELGLAHEMVKPTLMLLREGCTAPFDIGHLRHIRYSTDTEALKTLQLSLIATINNMFKEDRERDFGLQRIQELKQQRIELERRQSALQKTYVAVPEFVRKEVGLGAALGIVRLHPGRSFDDVGQPFHGAYYAFLKDDHRYGYGSDISYRDRHLRVGFAGWDYGYFLSLGEITVEQLKTCGLSLPSWLQERYQEAWELLCEYAPPTTENEVRAAQRGSDSLKLGKAELSNTMEARVGHSYLLRSINYGRWDILVIFRIHTQLPDGSLVLVWKLLKEFVVPKG